MDIKNLNNFKNKNIILIGDVAIDIYEYYKSTESSPEHKDIPKCILENRKINLGMTGNVATNLAALGANVYFFCVGNREFYDELMKISNKFDNRIKLIFYSSDNITYKKRIIVNNKHIMRIDEDINISKDEKILFRFDSILSLSLSSNINIDAIILSDYNRGLIKNYGQEFINKLKNKFKNISIFYDPHEKQNNIPNGIDYLTPNLKEAKAITKNKTNFYLDTYNNLINKNLAKNIILKLSEDGVVFKDEDNKVQKISACKESVIDVSGAGDTLVSVLALALSSGFSLYDSVNIANIASGLVVMKEGTQPVYFEELEKELKNYGK